VSWKRELERVPALAGLPAAELLDRGQVRHWIRGDILWAKGDAGAEFAFVLRGRVELRLADIDESETVLDVVGPGELICAPVPCLRMSHCCRAIALERTSSFSLPRDALVGADDPRVDALVRAIANRHVGICQRLRDTLGRSAFDRVTATLRRLCDESDARVRSDGRVQLGAIRRVTLAGLTGLRTETVSRVLSDLKRKGLVELEGSHLVVDPSGLQLSDANRSD
jgi:CRP-like cAMP-binding protein